MSKIIVIGHLS